MKTVTYDETKFKLVPVEAERPRKARCPGWIPGSRADTKGPNTPPRGCFNPPGHEGPCFDGMSYFTPHQWDNPNAAAPVAERPPAQQQQPQTERDCREEFEQFCRTEYGWMDFRGSDGDDDYYDTRISEAWDFWQGAWLTWVPELTPDAPAAPMTTTDARPSSGR